MQPNVTECLHTVEINSHITLLTLVMLTGKHSTSPDVRGTVSWDSFPMQIVIFTDHVQLQKSNTILLTNIECRSLSSKSRQTKLNIEMKQTDNHSLGKLVSQVSNLQYYTHNMNEFS